MTQTSYLFSKKSLIVSALVALVGMAAPGAYAAFTDNFDALQAELQSRSTALTGSIDKTEQKQKKAVDKALVAIDKPVTTLAADVKTAGKLAKSLAKAFPDEFESATLVFSNDLSVVMDDVFEGLTSDVTDQFTTLQDTANALPVGTVKTKTLAFVTKAQTSLDTADGTTDYPTKAKALGSALKSIAGGVKAAAKGGGGGGCSSSTFTMTVSNEGSQWIATTPSASFTQSTGELILGATRGTNPFDTIAIGLVSPIVNGISDYDLSDSTIYITSAFVQYVLTSGTIHIAAIDTSAHSGPGNAFGTVSGNFSITAKDSSDNVITLVGSFDICDMVLFPTPP